MSDQIPVATAVEQKFTVGKHRRKLRPPKGNSRNMALVGLLMVWFAMGLTLALNLISLQAAEMNWENVSTVDEALDAQEAAELALQTKKANVERVRSGGGSIMIVGAIFLFIPLVKHQYRAKWMFRACLFTGVALIFFPIVGMGLGVALLTYLFAKRGEFPVGRVRTVEIEWETEPPPPRTANTTTAKEVAPAASASTAIPPPSP